LTHFALGLTETEPFALQGPLSVEVVKGYPATVPVLVTRATDRQALAVEVTGMIPTGVPGQPAPPGSLTFQPATAAAGAASAAFTVTAPVNAAEGTLDLVVQGKARVGNADRTLVGPAVAVTVVRPFDVALVTPGLEVKPGQSVTLKARLKRNGPFK